ncbi:MAG: GNAT family N-acetyltransferase [Defluviitaleaceae bacterium]|nr:GNAT family N-acetyltransferase [Defluviitaleaceae bacterium]
MEFIRATARHLEEVYSLLCELEGEILSKSDFTKIYNANMANENIHYVLPVDGGQVIGFGSIHIQGLLHHCANIGEIQELVIASGRQSDGIGARLFARLKEIAIENDCLLLEVCCNRVRERSHGFYLKQGMAKSHFKFTCGLEAKK